MADNAARKTPTAKAADKAAEVEAIDTAAAPAEKGKAAEKVQEPEFKDGIYTEHGVELANGNKIDVSAIVDRKLLPATYGSLLAEGNGPALTIATLTTHTRRMLDLAGATFEDLEEVLPQVIERSREAADSEDK